MQVQQIIKGPLQYASKHHLLDEDLWECMDVNYSQAKAGIKPLSHTQVFDKREREILVAQAKLDFQNNPSDVRPIMFLLCDQTGLRNGELCGLIPSDIINNKVLYIQRQETKYYKNGKLVRKVVPYTKSQAGVREIPLTTKALKALEDLSLTGNFLFENNGKRVTTSQMSSYLKSLCSRTGIQHRSMHKVRKTFISALFALNLHPEKIREISGHSDLATLYKSYCFNIDPFEEVLAKMNAA